MIERVHCLLDICREHCKDSHSLNHNQLLMLKYSQIQRDVELPNG